MNYKYENLDRLIYILIGALLAVVFELASRARISAHGHASPARSSSVSRPAAAFP